MVHFQSLTPNAEPGPKHSFIFKKKAMPYFFSLLFSYSTCLDLMKAFSPLPFFGKPMRPPFCGEFLRCRTIVSLA